MSDVDITFGYAIPFPVQRDSSTVSGEITLFLSIESVGKSFATSLPSLLEAYKYLRKGFG
ncbi:MAG: hypothetical protein WCD68_17835 [Candidatus Acidiferrum sp.]